LLRGGDIEESSAACQCFSRKHCIEKPTRRFPEVEANCTSGPMVIATRVKSATVLIIDQAIQQIRKLCLK
jgi:hypothetical protein